MSNRDTWIGGKINREGNNAMKRTKRYSLNARSGGAHTEGPRRREQSRSKQNAEQKALRFPGGEGVMPPAVWGL